MSAVGREHPSVILENRTIPTADQHGRQVAGYG